MVVDGQIGFTGGVNLREGNCLAWQPKSPVQDLHFRVTGPVVTQLQEVFADDWEFCTDEILQGETWFMALGARVVRLLQRDANAACIGTAPAAPRRVKSAIFQWVRIPPRQSVARPEAIRAVQEVTTALRYSGATGRLSMNPPFEDAADRTHIQRAYSLLEPGGRLVSVISEGPFFRVDNKSVTFRDWLEDVSAAVERLPDDAFQGRGAFRETGVRTRLITVTKEDHA